MSESKTYSAGDIERYHRGQMTAAERHLLEKAALDDPMLADALEGYAATTTASSDLQLLQQQLQKRIEKDEERKGWFIGSAWLKAAAVFLLVAGGGWLVLQTFSGKKNVLSQTPTGEALAVNDKQSSQKITLDSASTNLSKLTADSAANSQDVAVAETKTPSYKVKKPPPVTTLKSEAKGYLQQDKEVEKQTVSRSLARTEENAEAADSNRIPAGNAASNVTVRVLNDSTKQVDVVLKKLDSHVDEVVISKAKAQPRARNVPVVIDSLEPEKGWSSFDDYVAENLKAPGEFKTKPTYDKEVELSFDVDSEGNPTNVKVTKSLCEKCDAEAVRILKEGPRWKGKSTKGKVKIRFPQSP